MNLAPLENWLQEHTGLDAASLGFGVVGRAAQERMTALACKSLEKFLAVLAVSAEERLALIERIVVPETWFFRDRSALDALARHVVTSWGPAHAGETLRVLSVPCATGEEPYSIAMALALAGWPLSRLRIDAVDISAVAIAVASEGVYGRNSFRGGDLDFRSQFFTTNHPNRWRIAPDVCAPVHFETGNLLGADFAAGRERYDVIFCRNLLIYFGRPSQARSIAVLERLLAPDGWLAVGPAEPVLLFEHGFEALDVPSAFLLKKTSSRPARERPATRSPVRPAQGLKPSTVRSRVRIAPPLATRARLSTPPVEVDTLEHIRALADTGRLREAAERGAAVLARGAPTAELLYLLAVIEDAAGEVERAEALYRKVIYLDPHHADALFHLALIAEKRGDKSAARRLRERAQRFTEGGAA